MRNDRRIVRLGDRKCSIILLPLLGLLAGQILWILVQPQSYCSTPSIAAPTSAAPLHALYQRDGLLLLQPRDVEQSVGHEDENNSSLEATVDVGLVGADQAHLSTTVEAGQPGLS